MNVLNIGIEYTMRSMKVLARFGGFLAANITVNRLTTVTFYYTETSNVSFETKVSVFISVHLQQRQKLYAFMK